jgi:hypothetical protein
MVGLRRVRASLLALPYDVGVFLFRQTSVGARSRTRAYHVWVPTPATWVGSRGPTTAHQAVTALASRYHTAHLCRMWLFRDMKSTAPAVLCDYANETMPQTASPRLPSAVKGSVARSALTSATSSPDILVNVLPRICTSRAIVITYDTRLLILLSNRWSLAW